MQIKLAPVHAPYFAGAKLLIAADCTAYAYANFHQEFMRGKVTLIGCPKLDAVDYSEKLTEILRSNDIQSVTILRMEVPCCGGLEMAAKKALQTSGKFIPWQVVTIPLTEKFWTKCGNTDRPSVFDFGLFQGGAGSAHKILHGLHRVLPGGGLPGKHHAGSAVCHGVVDVADLGAGGDRRLHILSSIWVTTIKGTPADRQTAESCFWHRGSSHRGMALPSPRGQ